jgi:hypothetical protein
MIEGDEHDNFDSAPAVGSRIEQAMAIDPEVLTASLRRLAALGKPRIGVVEALRHVTEACMDLRCGGKRHHAGR